MSQNSFTLVHCGK